MPNVDVSSKGPRPGNQELAEWWSRGYDLRGPSLGCMACGADIVKGLTRPGDDKPYWQVHDLWHLQNEARLPSHGIH